MFGDISPLPLGEGRILNELASCKNSGGGGLGEVYNVLEEVSGLGQGSTNFRHSERSEESQLTSLRSNIGNIFILPLILRNLNTTPSLALPLGEGKMLYPLAPCGRGKNWLMSECEFNNSGEGCYARSPADKYW